MLLHLILKDLRAFHKFVLTMIILPGMAWCLVLIYPQFHTGSYIRFSAIATICMTAYLIFYERKEPNEALICSLPVTRSAIVSSRYWLALMLSVAGILIFWGTAFLAHLYYTNSVTRFEDLNNLQTLASVIFIISISLSIFLPSTYRFRLFGMIMSCILAVTNGLLLQYHLFESSSILDGPFSQDMKWLKFTTLTGLAIFSPLMSYQLAKFYFSKKDI